MVLKTQLKFISIPDSSKTDEEHTSVKVKKGKKRKLSESNTEVKEHKVTNKKTKPDSKKVKYPKDQKLLSEEISEKETLPNKLSKKKKARLNTKSPENEIVEGSPVEDISKNKSIKKAKVQTLEKKAPSKPQTQSEVVTDKSNLKEGTKKNKKQLKKKRKAKQLNKKGKTLMSTKKAKSQSNGVKSQSTTDVNNETKSTNKKGIKQKDITDLENKKTDIKNKISEPQETEKKSDDKAEPKGFPKHGGNNSKQENEEPKYNEEQESRTTFVGNLPLKITRSRVTNMFKTYGEVETVRFRSVPVADIKLPRKACVKMNKIHEKRTNMNAYVRFKNIESVEKALELNGHVIDEHTIRVDRAMKKTTVNSHAIFIGNLPFGKFRF